MLDGVTVRGAQYRPLTTPDGITVLRNHRDPSSISDLELGIAALLLLLAVVVTVVFVPALA